MEKVEKLNIAAILEGKVNELKTSKAGTWLGDELIIMTYPLDAFVGRVVDIGYDFTGQKKMETKLRKVLPEIIKADLNFGRSIIDIMADKEIADKDKADMIDANVDDFIEEHEKELSLFNSYRR